MGSAELSLLPYEFLGLVSREGAGTRITEASMPGAARPETAGSKRRSRW